MRYLKVVVIFAAMAMLILAGCQKNSTPAEQGTGTLRVLLTDAPADFDAVNISFSQVAAHVDSGWVVVKGDPVTVNLMDWNNGKYMILGESSLPAGHYTQIRLMIDSASVVVNGETFHLDVPSGMRTGLKLGPEFTVEPGSTYELVLDFNADQSIVVMGPRWHPHGFKLKPHIRCLAKALTGSISGTVTNSDALPSAYAIQDGDTVTSTIVNSSTGYFMLSFLPEGSYMVSVSDTSNRSFEKDSVAVNAGTDTSLGQITLQ